jgi:hypothetical protein
MARLRDAWDYFRNARVFRNAPEYATLLPDYFRSGPAAGPAEQFENVHTCVLFIGVGRSGTTLLGALLDAHPDMVVANQQCLLKYVYPLAFSRERIFRLMLRNSIAAARSGRPGGGGYAYAVPGQWQGRFRMIQVIGDKSRSAQSVEWLHSRPQLLENLAAATAARVRLVHVIRNPWDTIARRSLRRGVSLNRISRQYFALVEKLQTLTGRLEGDAALDVRSIQVYLEDLVADPAAELARLCTALGVCADADYLTACAGIVSTPSTPRRDVRWPPELAADITRRVQDVPHLRRYSPND